MLYHTSLFNNVCVSHFISKPSQIIHMKFPWSTTPPGRWLTVVNILNGSRHITGPYSNIYLSAIYKVVFIFFLYMNTTPLQWKGEKRILRQIYLTGRHYKVYQSADHWQQWYCPVLSCRSIACLFLYLQYIVKSP